MDNYWIGMAVICCVSCGPMSPAFAVAATATSGIASKTVEADTSPMLIRDPAVRAELGLSDDQTTALDALLAEVNGVLLAARDLPPDSAETTRRRAMERLRSQASRILTAEQSDRVTEIMVQAQGVSALLSEEVAEELGLTAAQRERLRRLIEPSKRKAKPAFGGSEDGPAGQRQRPSSDRLGRSALALLTPPQRKQWDELGGRPFDFTRVRPIGVYAPRFEEPVAWINSGPLKMSDLRGQVVVVHFYAFGCGNCIANYPWYRQWQADFASQGVTLVGIHTPETEAERDIEAVRRKARAANLTFPILVDNDRRNWLAWSNKVWPSVYLVDKAGRVRNWWYGELNWKGMQGQQRMRARIEALLKERAPATQPSTVPR